MLSQSNLPASLNKPVLSQLTVCSDTNIVMTNSAAFLTSTFNTTSQPSIFEVTAQQSLASTLGPACRHIIKVAARYKPEQCGFLTKLQDELLLLANSLLQLHYLKVQITKKCIG